jgi:predicted RNA binding protein YcfA (HicA-like mRNA interferase family)
MEDRGNEWVIIRTQTAPDFGVVVPSLSVFPSLKAGQLLAILKRKPLEYSSVRQRGSHRLLRSPNGFPELKFSFHDGTTLPRGLVRKILVKDVGLSEREALDLL